MTWLTVMEYLCHHGYVPLVANISQSFPHSWLITGFVIRLTQRVPLVEQELLTLPGHISSPRFLLMGFVLLDLLFMCMFCRSLFVLFRLAIVLSVLLRFTDSDYPFGIFKFFLHIPTRISYQKIYILQHTFLLKSHVFTTQGSII
jgi:hypothetical protein